MATLPPAAATVSPNGSRQPVRALACDELKIVPPHLGKITAAGLDDVQKQDVLSRLALPDWEQQLRHLLGDTSETVAANKANNAALDALCRNTRPIQP
jgi:hypothetical protein